VLILENFSESFFNNNKIDGKITECTLVNEDGIFLNFACEEGKTTLSRLVLRLMLSRSCCQTFSVRMTSRFEIFDEEYVEELKDKGENENRSKSTEYWKNVFKK